MQTCSAHTIQGTKRERDDLAILVHCFFCFFGGTIPNEIDHLVARGLPGSFRRHIGYPYRMRVLGCSDTVSFCALRQCQSPLSRELDHVDSSSIFSV